MANSPTSAADFGTIPAIAEDGSLFRIGKLEAHRSGQQHLAVSVFVFCGDELLIQRRAKQKYHCAGLWANTCCTHPHWGESMGDCAHRRLREELGFSLPLTARAVVDYVAPVDNGMIENERVHIFEGRVAATFKVENLDPAEVEETAWISRRELVRQIATEPSRFTPWLRIYLERWDELSLRTAA